MILLLALAGPASAQEGVDERVPDSSGEVVRGQDIAAWRDLEVQRLESEERLAAWEEILVRWPESPLAETAYIELRDAGELDRVVADHPWLQGHVESLERSAAAHQRALDRHVSAIAVADLAPTGEPMPSAPPRFAYGLSVQSGWNGGSGFVALGGRVRVGWASLLVRVGVGDRRDGGPVVVYGQWGIRGYLPFTLGITRKLLPLGLFGEADITTAGRWSLLGGARLMLGPHWSIEASTGLSARHKKFGPALAAELAYIF